MKEEINIPFATIGKLTVYVSRRLNEEMINKAVDLAIFGNNFIDTDKYTAEGRMEIR